VKVISSKRVSDCCSDNRKSKIQNYPKSKIGGACRLQQATKFEFIINLKAAKQIGLTIPVRVLERANKVIK
jgi:hypothetical protein